MKVDRRGDSNGGIYDTIKLTVDEEAALDRCHEILRQRFANEGNLMIMLKKKSVNGG